MKQGLTLMKEEVLGMILARGDSMIEMEIIA
jgi:hypothetical protein